MRPLKRAMKPSLASNNFFRFLRRPLKVLKLQLRSHWANKSDLAPMRKVGEMIQRHLENLLTFCRHRITNGVAEGLNSKIMAIKRKACGYRNRDHFKTAIYFFCGGLDLYPTSSWSELPTENPGGPKKRNGQSPESATRSPRPKKTPASTAF